MDKNGLTECGHASVVRLHVYGKDCRSCGSVTRFVLPRLRKDFPSSVCVHVHEFRKPPAGQRMPVLVALSREMHLVVVEGMPDYERLREVIQAMVSLCGG